MNTFFEEESMITNYAELYLKKYAQLKKNWCYQQKQGKLISSSVKRNEYLNFFNKLCFELSDRTSWDYDYCRTSILKKVKALKEMRNKSR